MVFPTLVIFLGREARTVFLVNSLFNIPATEPMLRGHHAGGVPRRLSEYQGIFNDWLQFQRPTARGLQPLLRTFMAWGKRTGAPGPLDARGLRAQVGWKSTLPRNSSVVENMDTRPDDAYEPLRFVHEETTHWQCWAFEARYHLEPL